MRVAILTRDYPPTIGGVATHVEGLLKALRRVGVEVDLYVGRNDVRTLLLPFGIPLRNYDVVHVQSLPYGAFVFGVPLVVTVHSPVIEEFRHYRRALRIASFPAIALEKISLSRAAAVLAVSDQSRSDLFKRYRPRPERVEVIGNGVDFDRFSLPRRTAQDGGVRRVLVVSRLEARKNVQEAIEAVARLPSGACQLDVAGEGSERAGLAHLAKDLGAVNAVHFLGRVSEDDLPDLYSSADIFLTTSRSEGFGLSLLEAMSSGCACIASDLPTHRALVENGVSGMIYRSRTELVAQLKSLLDAPEQAISLGTSARRVAREHTWDNVGRKVAGAYERVINRSR